eukprot:365029-Chlamydomonas_euryale.AAC.7
MSDWTGKEPVAAGMRHYGGAHTYYGSRPYHSAAAAAAAARRPSCAPARVAVSGDLGVGGGRNLPRQRVRGVAAAAAALACWSCRVTAAAAECGSTAALLSLSPSAHSFRIAVAIPIA